MNERIFSARQMSEAEIAADFVAREREACAALIETLHEGVSEMIAPDELADIIRNREKFEEVTEADLHRARQKGTAMNERRYAILWIPRNTMIDLIHGAVRITNLPSDCRVDAMGHELSRDAIALRLWSKEFPVSAGMGEEIRNFTAEFSSVKYAKNDALHRYMSDPIFRELVRTLIHFIRSAGCGPVDLEQAFLVIKAHTQHDAPEHTKTRQHECGCIVGLPHSEKCPRIQHAKMIDGECIQDAQGNFIEPEIIEAKRYAKAPEEQ